MFCKLFLLALSNVKGQARGGGGYSVTPPPLYIRRGRNRPDSIACAQLLSKYSVNISIACVRLCARFVPQLSFIHYYTPPSHGRNGGFVDACIIHGSTTSSIDGVTNMEAFNAWMKVAIV